MPRKEYIPKNKYCRNTNLTEKELEVLLWFYVQGASAPRTQREMEEMDDVRIISTKSVARYFKRFGDYIFMKTVEPAWLVAYPFMNQVKADFPQEKWEEYLEIAAKAMVGLYSDLINYDSFRAAIGDQILPDVSRDVEIELRKLRSARQGIKNTFRGDFALAQFRCSIARTVGKERNLHGELPTEKQKIIMVHQSLLMWMREDPM